MARSNSANEPTICIIIRPAAVVVSMFSVNERKPPPDAKMRSMMCGVVARTSARLIWPVPGAV